MRKYLTKNSLEIIQQELLRRMHGADLQGHCHLVRRLVMELEDFIELREKLFKLAPSLKEEGLENFDGYFVHWNVITEACCKYLGEGTSWSESPLELITQLIDRIDELEGKHYGPQA